MDDMDVVRTYYNTEVETEWKRIEDRPEFLITCRFLDHYIKSGDRVLDIGGGPGRYAIWLAEKGCDTTMIDLSPENVRFAGAKAGEKGLTIRAIEGDARTADEAVQGPFDHVLLMGPLYHLQDEADRMKAMNACLRLLKPGGLLYASFLNLYSPLIYAMKFEPECVLDQSESSLAYLQAVLDDQSFAGTLFTQAFFIKPQEILPFMARFPLETLHFFGQEGILSPCENTILSQSQETIDAWLDLSVKLTGREELLNWSEHLMVIGRKK